MGVNAPRNSVAVGDPIAIYLMDGGAPVGPIAGIISFTMAVPNPTIDAESNDARSRRRPARRRMSSHRAIRQHRLRRADPEGIRLSLEYNPLAPAHRMLRHAGESGAPLTLRLVLRDAAGQPAQTQELRCFVPRCALRYRPDWMRVTPQPDGKPPYICRAELRLLPLARPRAVTATAP